MRNKTTVIDAIANIKDDNIRRDVLMQLVGIITEDYTDGLENEAITEEENNPANHANDLVKCVSLTSEEFKQTFYFDFLDDNFQKYFE